MNDLSHNTCYYYVQITISKDIIIMDMVYDNYSLILKIVKKINRININSIKLIYFNKNNIFLIKIINMIYLGNYKIHSFSFKKNYL